MYSSANNGLDTNTLHYLDAFALQCMRCSVKIVVDDDPEHYYQFTNNSNNSYGAYTTLPYTGASANITILKVGTTDVIDSVSSSTSSTAVKMMNLFSNKMNTLLSNGYCIYPTIIIPFHKLTIYFITTQSTESQQALTGTLWISDYL